jgi:anaerobic magnesium-protoporphyrin IX monomethyl ester cyclase
MAKILFIQPNYGTTQNKNIPIAQVTLATLLNSRGHETKILDRNLDSSDTHLKYLLKSFNPDIVGMTSMTGPMLLDLAHVSRIVKENSSSLVIVGGIHATLEPQCFLNLKTIDYVVRAEGEIALLQICKLLDNGKKNFSKLNNVNFNKLNPPINLNDYPVPDYDLVDVKKYPLIMFVTSRGCPWGKCTFCYNSWTSCKNNPLRMYNAENTLKMMTPIIEKYNLKEFEVGDDNFGLPNKRTFQVCKELSRYNVAFHIFQRVDLMQDNLVVALKRAGCWSMQFGFESGSQRILDLMKKGTTIKQNEQAIKIAKKHDIFIDGSFMVGIPGETMRDIEETVSFIKRNKPDSVDAKILIPYPGTEIYKKCVEAGKITAPKTLEDWSAFFSKKEGRINVSDIPTDVLLKVITQLNKKSSLIYLKKFKKLLFSGHSRYIKLKAREIAMKKLGYKNI